MLKMYARKNDPNQPNSRGIPFGVVVGQPTEDGNVVIGWSQCSDSDHFDRNLGTTIAIGRLNRCPASGDLAVSGYNDPAWRQEFVDTVQRVVNEIKSNPERYRGIL